MQATLVFFLLLAGSFASASQIEHTPLEGRVPAAPAHPEDARDLPLCQGDSRDPETEEDRELVAAGWLLFRAYQSTRGTRVVMASPWMDAQCRPGNWHAFAFSDGQAIHHVSAPMSDGGLVVLLNDACTLYAEARYRMPSDPACCPSGRTESAVSLCR